MPTSSFKKGSLDTLLFFLSAIGGYADICSFIGLDGLFTAHVTGNLVIAGARMVLHHMEGTFLHIMALPCFALSVTLTAIAVHALAFSQKNMLSQMLWFEGAVFALHAFLCTYYAPLPQSGLTWPLLYCSATGVMAMGIQNGYMRQLFPQTPPTTVMTGNFTQIFLDIIQWLLADKQNKPAMQRAWQLSLGLGGFVLGAMLGAWGMAVCHALCLWLLPVLLVVLGFWQYAR